MWDLTMRFYVTETPDGLIHVQNVIGPFLGQHHVHTKEGYEKWKRSGKIKKKNIIYQKGECNCGLKPSQVREYDGHVWTSDRF